MSILTKTRPPNDSESGSPVFDVSDGDRDPDWDAFLSGHPSGQHVQSSRWAEVKALNGWATRRITVSQDARVIGGAQLLIRNMRYVGPVGYVPKGPLLAGDDEDLANGVLDRIQIIAKSQRIRMLFVQPPEYGAIERQLAAHGFGLCPFETAPSATVLVDLSEDLDVILSRMKKGMRNRVRRSQKRGINVREGSKDDLPVFHKLLSATSRRQDFSTFELDYFQGMWDILDPIDGIKLFIGEFDGEAVSAQFCIPFGDRLVAKQIGWSGKYSRLHPNEALDWYTIKWAKDQGFKYYDLEGIERQIAEAIIEGQPLPERYAESPASYKLRLGGEVKLMPAAYCFVANPVLRSIYNRVGCQVANWSIVKKSIGRFRTG